MLFVSEKLHSIFDFGNEIVVESASLSSLCKEIIRVSTVITEMLTNGEEIRLAHGDITNSKKSISPSILENIDLHDRDEISLQTILYRKTSSRDYSHTAISFHLHDMGIVEPISEPTEWFRYYQLLYFFYITRYYVYPDDNLFLLLKEKRRSTYFVPNNRAAGGDYWHFIISNLFDDKNAARLYSQRDICFSAAISLLTSNLEKIINEDKDPYQNLNTAKKVRELISQVASIPPEKTAFYDPIEQMLDMAYQYQMLAYSGDMIKNLGDNQNLFQFGELNYELPLSWQRRYIEVNKVEAFLKEKETLTFCFQEEKDYSRPEKYVRGNAFSFINEIINYDESLAQNGQPRLFTIEENGKVVILADWAAIIVKTFLDTDEELKMVYPNGSDWKAKQSLQRALSAEKTLVTDLAMRLFVVAFHSGYLNAHRGYGYYWPLFKCIYLNHYLLLQEMVFAAFSGTDCGIWARRLNILIDRISNI